MPNTIHQFSNAKRAFAFAEKEILMGRTCKVGMQSGLWEVEPLAKTVQGYFFEPSAEGAEIKNNREVQPPRIVSTVKELINLPAGTYTLTGEASAEFARRAIKHLTQRQNNPCGGRKGE